ncbi:hypothetical protein V6Z12_A11G174500 [Gossypium hirsutum]
MASRFEESGTEVFAGTWWCTGVLTWRWRRRLALGRPRVSSS